MRNSALRNIDILRNVCKEAGIRLTPQRIEIFKLVSAAKNHPSAEDIHQRLRSKMPTVSLDTVYRTLSTLERCGMISRVEVLDGRSRFDPNITPHHHLVCTQCKRVQDFSWPEFDRMNPPTETEKWGSIKSCHGELRGVCNKCLAEER
jgi:Fur family peroxide stress response transcriptional regulator